MVKKNKKPSADGEPGPIMADPALPKKSGSKSSSVPQSPGSSALVICRNKHWRYISSFHGPWLSLPLEVLETLANANYYMPVPRPVDPAVFYDLMKIRRLVDDATDIAVRAANGVTTAAMPNSMAGGTGQHMQALGLYGNNGMKLSAERRHRLREQATQKLSRAYYIDEIASSVATMQSSSTLESVAGLVLQRAASDPDATYVHFFHEKIPSRQLAECTSLDALNSVIAQRPSDCEPFRTRAIVRMFKNDYEGAAQDLTNALAVYRFHQAPHKNPVLDEGMQLQRRNGRRRDMPSLDERDQPSSTEVQLLFQRAGCYLTLACDHVADSLPADGDLGSGDSHDVINGVKDMELNDQDGAPASPSLSPTESPGVDKAPSKKLLDNRKSVRLYAKRALRDYMDYLKTLYYSPNLPVEVTEYFAQQVNQSANRERKYHTQWRGASQLPISPADGPVAHTVHSLADLFNATPPGDLPPYPSTALVTASAQAEAQDTTTEFVTYHPLLTDALHSLLLCHALIQTSARELQRHAHMVARLARLADGYPIFQASRSPARADWIEVLRRAENWISLSSSWEALCSPAPLPAKLTKVNSADIPAAAAASINQLAKAAGLQAIEPGEETEDSRKERQRHQAILEALEDERVNDEASFKAAILARQRRAEAEHSSSAMGNGSSNGGGSPNVPAAPKRWAVDDGREYPILTERAEAVARWVREAPAGSGVGGGKRKKKPAASSRKPAPAATASSDALEDRDA